MHTVLGEHPQPDLCGRLTGCRGSAWLRGRTLLSSAPVAMVVPSGEKAAVATSCAWPYAHSILGLQVDSIGKAEGTA